MLAPSLLYTVCVCRTVVIMAERSKSEMDQAVQAALKGYNIRWQTREGAPYSASDLAKVSASQASTVILMRPDNSRVQYKDDDSPAVRRKRLHQVCDSYNGIGGSLDSWKALGVCRGSQALTVATVDRRVKP